MAKMACSYSGGRGFETHRGAGTYGGSALSPPPPSAPPGDWADPAASGPGAGPAAASAGPAAGPAAGSSGPAAASAAGSSGPAAAPSAASAAAAVASASEAAASESKLAEETKLQKQRAAIILKALLYEVKEKEKAFVPGKGVPGSSILLKGAPSYGVNGSVIRAEADAFMRLYPTAPRVDIPAAWRRAAHLRGDGGWTTDTMHAVADTFGTSFFLMCVMPELTHFDLLVTEPAWRKGDSICMPCAACKTNEYVELDCSTLIHGSKQAPGVKFFHDIGGVPGGVIGSRYFCSNPKCAPVYKKAFDDGIDLNLACNAKAAIRYRVSFTAYTEGQMAMLPARVRMDFPFTLMPANKGGYSHSLRELLLHSTEKQAQCEDTLRWLYAERTSSALEAYTRFAHAEQAHFAKSTPAASSIQNMLASEYTSNLDRFVCVCVCVCVLLQVNPLRVPL